MFVFKYVANYWTSKLKSIDRSMRNEHPVNIIKNTVITVAVVAFTYDILKTRWNETVREKLGRWLRQIRIVDKEYQKFLGKETESAIIQMKEKWQVFGDPVLKIPDHGWTFDKIVKLIETYYEITTVPLINVHTSGSIYTNNFTGSNVSDHLCKVVEKYYRKQNHIFDSSNNKAYFDHKAKLIDILSVIVFILTNKMNPLHDEFKVGVFVEEQVIAMAAEYVGGNIKDMSGVVTSGGTESLMLGMRSYRNRGVELMGLEPGEPVVLVSPSVHAAVYKAGLAYNIRVVEVKMNSSYRIDLDDLIRKLAYYGDKVVAIVGSSPSYPTGVIDPIEEMASIALAYNVGFHVDCCLGGFILENQYAQIDGVTSISIDIHKFGMCSKGSSVLLCKKMNGIFLNYYAIYAVPYWKGGLYGTTRDAGSYSAANAFIAFVTMLAVGKEGYQRQAHLLLETAQNLRNRLANLTEDNRLIVVNKDEQVPMVTLTINKSYIEKQGAIYAFADEMLRSNNKRPGFLLSKISDDMVHFCLTVRFASEETCIDDFIDAANTSLIAVKARDDAGESFAKIGGYGSLEYSLNPKLENTNRFDSVIKFIQNWFLGTTGAKDAIRQVLMAQHFYNFQ